MLAFVRNASTRTHAPQPAPPPGPLAGGEPREGVRGRGRKRRGDWRTKHPAGLPALRPGMASWTTPDLSGLPRRPLDLPDVRSGGRRGPRAALRHRRGVAPLGQGLRRRLEVGAPSARCGRRRRPPRPRARRAGRIREARQRARWSTMLWRMDSTRVPGDAEKRPRGNPATRVPEVVGRGVDEVDAVTLPAPRGRPRPACDPRAPSADVRRCRTSSRSRSPARPRTRRPTRADTPLRTSATATAAR